MARFGPDLGLVGASRLGDYPDCIVEMSDSSEFYKVSCDIVVSLSETEIKASEDFLCLWLQGIYHLAAS